MLVVPEKVGMLGVIISAITVIMLGYLMVGFSGYLAFPTTVEGNVLKNFPTNDLLLQASSLPLPRTFFWQNLFPLLNAKIQHACAGVLLLFSFPSWPWSECKNKSTGLNSISLACSFTSEQYRHKSTLTGAALGLSRMTLCHLKWPSTH